jgi:carbon-monoxide dehydrogenase large subunit
MPAVALDAMESPSPLNALGAKGLGEGGTIAAPPAILSAALDALAPFGVRDLQLPLTSQTLWQAIREATA